MIVTISNLLKNINISAQFSSLHLFSGVIFERVLIISSKLSFNTIINQKAFNKIGT